MAHARAGGAPRGAPEEIVTADPDSWCPWTAGTWGRAPSPTPVTSWASRAGRGGPAPGSGDRRPGWTRRPGSRRKPQAAAEAGQVRRAGVAAGAARAHRRRRTGHRWRRPGRGGQPGRDGHPQTLRPGAVAHRQRSRPRHAPRRGARAPRAGYLRGRLAGPARRAAGALLVSLDGSALAEEILSGRPAPSVLRARKHLLLVRVVTPPVTPLPWGGIPISPPARTQAPGPRPSGTWRRWPRKHSRTPKSGRGDPRRGGLAGARARRAGARAGGRCDRHGHPRAGRRRPGGAGQRGHRGAPPGHGAPAPGAADRPAGTIRDDLGPARRSVTARRT